MGQHELPHARLNTLASGSPFLAANDMTVTPTYVPDLVHVCLDLLIDRENGLWHLTNAQPITWADLALKACDMAGIDAGRLEARGSAHLDYLAPRPIYSALHSQRERLLPTLDDAMERYLRLQQQASRQDESGQAAQVGNG